MSFKCVFSSRVVLILVLIVLSTLNLFQYFQLDLKTKFNYKDFVTVYYGNDGVLKELRESDPKCNHLFCGKFLRRIFSVKKKKINHHVCSRKAENEIYRRTQYNLKKKKEWKIILLWTSYNQNKYVWQKVFARHCLKECKETRCELTTDHRRLREANAVLFHGNSLNSNSSSSKHYLTLPKKRNKNKIYIFYSTEPPTRYGHIDLDAYENFFNWTMTYRRDSDVVMPYGVVFRKRKKMKSYSQISQEELNKKKLGIWLNSHCENYPRVNFAKRLQRYVNITVYGLCVNKTCGKRALMKLTTDVGEDSCEKSFGDYVFFMALENSLCKDYVTEKLYRSLKLGIIPVTFGAVNYTEFAPPHSFIDAKDFSSEMELASYMKKVASNATLYNEYFKWKENYDVDVGLPYKPLICDLCNKLHSPEAKLLKSYASIKDWFIKESECTYHLRRRRESNY